MKPIVTVAIPTYNRVDLLIKSIDSVLLQTFTGFQIIVFDNCSTDNTREAVLSYKDKRVVYYRQPANVGMTKNWHSCFTIPDTEYIAFLHDDDLYEIDHLESAVNALSQNEQTSLYSCAVQCFGDENHILRPPYNSILNNLNGDTIFDLSNEYFRYHWLYFNQVPCPSSVVFRAKHAKGLDWFDYKFSFAIDYLVFFQLNLTGHWYYNTKVGVRYLRHSNSSTNTGKWNSNVYSALEIRLILRYIGSKLFINLNDLEKFVETVKTWPASAIYNVIISFMSIQSDKNLKHIALTLLKECNLPTNGQIPKHAIIGSKVGNWYYYIADSLDKVRSKIF